MSKKIKVLFVTDSFSTGGKEKQLALLVSKLLSVKEFEIFLVLRSNDTTMLNQFPENQLYVLKEQKNYGQFLEIFKLILKIQPDIVHSWQRQLSFLTSFACLLTRCKHIDGSIRFAKNFSRISRQCIYFVFIKALSTFVIANSVAGLKSHGIKRNKKNLVIYNGIDIQEMEKSNFFPKKNNSESFLKILMIANFTSAKDQQSLVQATIILNQKKMNIHTTFIGNGPNYRSIIADISDLHKDYFSFEGLQKDVSPWLRSADIGVLLSKKNHSEGFSNAIMEYMAAGLPVIASSTGGNLELVEENKSGFLIKQENTDILIKKILFLRNNARQRLRMGQMGKRRIKIHFSSIKMYKQYSKLYSDLIKG